MHNACSDGVMTHCSDRSPQTQQRLVPEIRDKAQ
jgi:hypothetical protein